MVDRLRILMLSDVDPVHVIGGAERMLNEHSRRLAARGHRVVVLTRCEDPTLPGEETVEGVRVVRHPVRGRGAIALIRSVLREGGSAFARLVDQERFDLINVHQPLAGAAGLRRPESRGIPVLYTYLSPWSDEYRIRFNRRVKVRHPIVGPAVQAWVGVNSQARERVEREVVDRSDRLMVLSEFSVSQLKEIHGVDPARVTIVPGGVDTERFRPAPDRRAVRQSLGLPEAPLLFTVRNLVPRMGLDALIAAMPEVIRVVPGCRLHIGGSGPLRESLEQQAADLGLSDHVRFEGFIPEERLPDFYAVADLFVLPTRCLEGFGLVTVEALACGTPAAGTPVGGTLEILRRFDPSFLFRGVESGDIAARLVEKLPATLGNDGLRARCRQHVLETYAWEALIPQVEQVMEEVARGAAAVGSARA
jgi:glycosyltransferase involved in cell wall biosynthesis